MSCFRTKPAGEAREFALDWDDLAEGETLAECLGWTIVPQELDPQGLALAGSAREAARMRATLRGGRPGHIYHVACRARTSAGRVMTRGFLLRVE
jgi:hypothetical protein